VGQGAGRSVDEREGARARRLGLTAGMVVQELGWDEDADDELRADVERVTGTELVDDQYADVVDAVLLWWRDGDGDLFDALLGALTDLTKGGVVWLLTPKVGRDGYVDPSEVTDAAPSAGLATTTTAAVSADWTATRLVAPRGSRGARR
jgi:hypothetical protein